MKNLTISFLAAILTTAYAVPIFGEDGVSHQEISAREDPLMGTNWEKMTPPMSLPPFGGGETTWRREFRNDGLGLFTSASRNKAKFQGNNLSLDRAKACYLILWNNMYNVMKLRMEYNLGDSRMMKVWDIFNSTIYDIFESKLSTKGFLKIFSTIGSIIIGMAEDGMAVEEHWGGKFIRDFFLNSLFKKLPGGDPDFIKNPFNYFIDIANFNKDIKKVVKDFLKSMLCCRGMERIERERNLFKSMVALATTISKEMNSSIMFNQYTFKGQTREELLREYKHLFGYLLHNILIRIRKLSPEGSSYECLLQIMENGVDQLLSNSGGFEAKASPSHTVQKENANELWPKSATLIRWK
jgi:hypothetical protein